MDRKLKNYDVALKRGASLGDVKVTDLDEIDDANGNEILEFDSTTSAVNHIRVGNAATGGAPTLEAVGGDTNIDINLKPKGTGGVLYKDKTEVVAATNTILATESGSVFFLNHSTEFDSVLPAPAAGLHFTFIVTAAPSGANYTVSTNASANIIKGSVHSSTGGNADSETSGCDTITFADGAAVAGDMAELWCDGTNWFAQCFCDADAGITFDTAS